MLTMIYSGLCSWGEDEIVWGKGEQVWGIREVGAYAQAITN